MQEEKQKRAPGGGRKSKGGRLMALRLSEDTQEKVEALLTQRLLENPKFTKTDAVEEMIRAYKPR